MLWKQADPTGGGCALLTNDSVLAQRARHLSTTAKQPHPWDFNHDAIGWNDRMPNINAALGVAQLEDLDRRLDAKRLLAHRYVEAFSDLDGVDLVLEPPGCRSNHWLLALRFTSEDILVAQSMRLQLLSCTCVGFCFVNLDTFIIFRCTNLVCRSVASGRGTSSLLMFQ